MEPTETGTGKPTTDFFETVRRAARTLLGCYRTGDAHDPEIYLTAVIAVLSSYPTDVIELVVDPRSGLPGKNQWLPTIAEVKAECEAIVGQRRQRLEWDHRSRVQLAERKLIEQRDKPRPEVVDKIRAEMTAAGMPIMGDTNPVDNPFMPEKVMARFGLTQEQWDAIPNAPEDAGYWRGIRRAKPNGWKPTKREEEAEWRDHMAGR
jgi:hypothetical protein